MPTSPDLYNASEQAAGRLTPTMLDAASAAGGISEVQRRYGLVPDGKAGPQTQKVLAALAAGKVPIPTGRSGVEFTYGKFNYAEAQGGRIQISPAWVRENIVGVKLHTGKSVQFHRLAAAEFARLFEAACKTSGYTPASVQTFVPRHTLWDPSKSLSLHSWGIAVDFDPPVNPMGGKNSRLRTPQGQAFVQVFTDAGWTWGGAWAMRDDMHFQRANA
jgi:hypothetical protein